MIELLLTPYAIGAVAFAVGAGLTLSASHYLSRGDPIGDAYASQNASVGEVYSRKPAPVKGGWLSSLKKVYRGRRRKKALKKGYVRWYLLGDSISEEQLVKPKFKDGGNIPEVEVDGETYLFPEEAMIPSADDGVYVCMHRKGRADPIDLRSDNSYAIGAKTLKEYLTMRVTSSKPGLGLGLGDLDTKQLMTYGLLAIIGYAVLQGMI